MVGIKMIYFKDTNNNVFAYDDDVEPSYIKLGLTPITEQEAIALSQPVQEITFVPLTAWQIRKVLTQFGLRSSVEAAIALADQNTQDAWEYASEYKRDNELLLGMAQVLGLTDAQLDEMFEIGVSL